jgi:hypothetical protein
MSSIEELRRKYELWAAQDEVRRLELRLRLREGAGASTARAAISLSLLRRRLREAKEMLAAMESGAASGGEG